MNWFWFVVVIVLAPIIQFIAFALLWLSMWLGLGAFIWIWSMVDWIITRLTRK